MPWFSWWLNDVNWGGLREVVWNFSKSWTICTVPSQLHVSLGWNFIRFKVIIWQLKQLKSWIKKIPNHFSCLWYSLSKISFINLLFSIDRSYILDGFAALFYSKINSTQITSGLIISNSVLFFECCTFLSPLPFAAWTSPGFSFSRLTLQDIFLQPF